LPKRIKSKPKKVSKKANESKKGEPKMLRGSKQGYKKAHENKKRFLLSNRPNILLSLNKYFMSSVKNKNLMYS
jgi:hypothetical protein